MIADEVGKDASGITEFVLRSNVGGMPRRAPGTRSGGRGSRSASIAVEAAERDESIAG